MPEVGQPAPDFTLPRNGGGTLTLSAQRPKPVVLYFYPKDDTPGCTKQAITFTEMAPQFEAAGAEIIGISKDSVAKHDKFINKHALNITLVSDEDGDTCEQYGTWVEKNMYGKKHMGIERATFLIDAEGSIVQVWRKVKVPGHVEAVLDAVQAL
ncbi:thioredoxin-dependent thiol peroxidase [Jannaschia sp. CCS1]|uniref:thioredoxin-dependent thiol peroxidase n=1 Tax=Jannaschia sp. (strain CCS1) TaxID=290400 RepID=UPI000053D2BC|nr:thioredoxin-dependent thiol peroxidase [Jannaschia sp. CCS1]ABD54632.1 alkyl hydroperoxide reductase/ Thiol specific antioxidant/ Mal allergen [Jannaschia sp. CCS1]